MKWQHDSLCLPDTRVDIQNEITAWSEDAHDKTIYWLSGVAGTGKSTIARTVGQIGIGLAPAFSSPEAEAILVTRANCLLAWSFS